MARDRSPERDKAREIWLESGGKMTAKQVAEAVGGVKPEQVRKWKSLDSWAAALSPKTAPEARRTAGEQECRRSGAAYGKPERRNTRRIFGGSHGGLDPGTAGLH